MDLKKLKALTNNLLEARKNTLEQASQGVIRPYGKLWGMDVFAWNNPQIDALIATIHAFPFPVVWLTPSNLMKTVLEYDATINANIHSVIVYNNSAVKIEREKLDKDVVLQEATDISEAVEQLKNSRMERGVILFCSTGIDAVRSQTVFEAFLNLHQIERLK